MVHCARDDDDRDYNERVIRECVNNYFLYTKENPVFDWPLKSYFYWWEGIIKGINTKMTTCQSDYGFAGLLHIKRMADLEIKTGASCIKGKFLTDLKPNEGKHEPPIVPDCGTFCEIEFADIIDKNTERVLNGYTTMKQLKLF